MDWYLVRLLLVSFFTNPFIFGWLLLSATVGASIFSYWLIGAINQALDKRWPMTDEKPVGTQDTEDFYNQRSASIDELFKHALRTSLLKKSEAPRSV